MRISELFDRKIKYFEDEIKNLKTAHFKTATAISTMSVDSSFTLAIKLYGDPLTYWEMISAKKAIVTMTTLDGTDMVGAVYIKNLTPATTDDRYVFTRKISSTQGQLRYEIVMYSQNQNDFNTLSGGGQVNITHQIECVGSSRFSVDVSYEDFYIEQ